jgi:hypothetical protein
MRCGPVCPWATITPYNSERRGVAGARWRGARLGCARLADPTGYPSAVAALFVGGFWPAVFLASRRELPWAARGLLLAVAGLLLQMALIPQSRGALIVFPIALLIYLLVAPSHLRAPGSS